MRTEQETTADQLNHLIEEIEHKKETKLLRYCYNLLDLEYDYHQKAFKILTNLKPKLVSLKRELEESETKMNASKEGHLQQKVDSKWQKNYFVLKNGFLHCYKGKKDSQSIEHSLNIMLCTPRLPPKSKDGFVFEIVSPDIKKPIMLQTDTSKERDDWIRAIQGAIEYSLNQNLSSERGKKTSSDDELAFKILKKIHGNDFCADCGAPGILSFLSFFFIYY